MKKTTIIIFTLGLLLTAPLAHADELEKAIGSIKIPDAQAGLCKGWNDKYNEKCGGVKPGGREGKEGMEGKEGIEIIKNIGEKEVMETNKAVENKESPESSQSTKTQTIPEQTAKSEDEGKVLGASTDEHSAYSLLKKEIDALRAHLAATEKPAPLDWTPYWLLALILVTTTQNEWRLRKILKRITVPQKRGKGKVIKKSYIRK